MKATKIITNHYNNKSNFRPYILEQMLNMNDKQTQNVTAEIKIKRRANLGISDFWGLPWQSIITPTTVSYYEK
jgi:hypothetical protein